MTNAVLGSALPRAGQTPPAAAARRASGHVSPREANWWFACVGALLGVPMYWYALVPLFGLVAAVGLLSPFVRGFESRPVLKLSLLFIALAVVSTPLALTFAPLMARADVGVFDTPLSRVLASNLKVAYCATFMLVGAGLAARPAALQSLLSGFQWTTLVFCLIWFKLFYDNDLLFSVDIADARVVGREAMAALFGRRFSYMWPSTYALWLNVALGHTFYVLLRQAPRARLMVRVYQCICLVVFLVALLFTGTRAAWLMLLITIAYMSLTHPRYRRVLIYAMVILVGAALVLPQVREILTVAAETRMTSGAGDFAFGRELSTRADFWPIVIDHVMESPIIGHGGLGVGFFFGDDIGNSHNEMLSIVFRYGILGFALYLYAFYRALLANRELRRRNDSTLEYLAPLMVSSWFFGSFHESTHDSVFGALYFMFSGYMIGRAGLPKVLALAPVSGRTSASAAGAAKPLRAGAVTLGGG